MNGQLLNSGSDQNPPPSHVGLKTTDEVFASFAAPIQLNDAVGLSGGHEAHAHHSFEHQALLSRLHKVAAHLPGFIYEYRIASDGRRSFPYASEGIEKIYGITPQQARKDAGRVMEFIHPDDLERVEQSVVDSVSSGSPWTCDYRVVTGTHADRWVSGSANPEFQADGSILWFGFIHDITERKRIESELEKKSSLLQLLTETALEFINVPVDHADEALDHALADVGAFFGVDRAYLFDYDFSRQTSSNTHEWCAEGIEPFKDQLQEQPIEWDADWYASHLRGEEVLIPDVPAMPPSSIKKILTMQSIKSILTVPLMHQGKAIGFVGFDAVKNHRNFSSEELLLLKVFARSLASVKLRIEGHKALLDSRDQIEIFFDLSIGLLSVCDMQGRVLQVNQGWEEFLGQPKEQIEGTNFMNYVHHEDRAATEKVMQDLASGIRVEGFVNRQTDHCGRLRSLRWTAIMHKGLAYCKATDVTAEIEAAEAQANALKEARQAADTRRRLISMASHEFRTPLSSIRLSAEMLQHQISRSVEFSSCAIEKHLQRILTSTDHLTQVITEVLEVEGIQHKEKQTQMLDVVAVCNDCIETAKPYCGASRTVKLVVDSTPPQIEANAAMLKSSIGNLLDNAMKYSEKESPITVSVGADDGWLWIRVEDEGMGIPRDEADRIFLPFFRTSRTSHISGTGLGLAIVMKNIKRIGGRVEYRPNDRQGSIFTLFLPNP